MKNMIIRSSIPITDGWKRTRVAAVSLEPLELSCSFGRNIRTKISAKIPIRYTRKP